MEMGSTNSASTVSYFVKYMNPKPYTVSYTISILYTPLSTRKGDASNYETHRGSHLPLLVLYYGWEGGVVGRAIWRALAGGSLGWRAIRS